MAESTLTREVLFEHHDDEIIARLMMRLRDGDELIATPWMDALIYEFKDYDRGIKLCEHILEFGGELLNPLRVAKLKVALVNLERRKPQPNMERIQKWMAEAGDTSGWKLNAPGVRRTRVLWHYNAALLARLTGDFEQESFHHTETIQLAEDAFSRNNAAYMAEFAMMLHHAQAGTATVAMWANFQTIGDSYRATLNPAIPREAQWQANDWGHRVQLAILLNYPAFWLNTGFNCLARLLYSGVPQSSMHTADLMVALTLDLYNLSPMAIHVVQRTCQDETAGDWRILAMLLKARLTQNKEEYQAVLAMPGQDICYAARAVAARELATLPSA